MPACDGFFMQRCLRRPAPFSSRPTRPSPSRTALARASTGTAATRAAAMSPLLIGAVHRARWAAETVATAPIHAALAVESIHAEAMVEAFRDRGGGTADRIIAEDRTAMRVPAVVAVKDAAAVADGFKVRLERSGLAVDFAHGRAGSSEQTSGRVSGV